MKAGHLYPGCVATGCRCKGDMVADDPALDAMIDDEGRAFCLCHQALADRFKVTAFSCGAR